MTTHHTGPATTGDTAPDTARPGQSYLAGCLDRLQRLLDSEWPAIQAAASVVAEAYPRGGEVHLFGTGHSHLLAEEPFYRAGGLARIRPILFEGLMLHADAPLSTTLERLDGLADVLLAHHPIRSGDVLFAISNSGGNAVTSQLAQAAQQRGATVIAVTSLRHARSDQARHTTHPRLHELADIVLDNHGLTGDASVEIAGMATRVGPTSTVIGAALINAVMVEAVAVMADRGTPPEVYLSSNLAGGDDVNERLLATAPSVRGGS